VKIGRFGVLVACYGHYRFLFIADYRDVYARMFEDGLLE
jgi:hypothetical protein